MINPQRLEDLLPDWRKACAENVSNTALIITNEATSGLPAQVDSSDAIQQVTLSEAITREATQFAVDVLLPYCAKWLAEKQLAPPEQADSRTRAEAAIALRQRLPEFQPSLPPPTAHIPYKSWALPAAGGAALGCLALTPLSQMLLGQREAGLLVGGIIGAGLAVGLLARLSERPKMLDAIQKLVGTAGLLAALSGAVAVFRAKLIRPLKMAAWITGCWILLLLVRPRMTGPTSDQCREALRLRVERLLTHAADLVMALYWFHPDRSGPSGKKHENPPIPERVVDALGVLSIVSEDEKAPDQHLRGAIRALLQRVREEGYEWQTVPDGTSYDASLEERFDCFGVIEVGQPVEMLKPARIWNGKADKPGQLRAL